MIEQASVSIARETDTSPEDSHAVHRCRHSGDRVATRDVRGLRRWPVRPCAVRSGGRAVRLWVHTRATHRPVTPTL